jgi:hypothetical protein
VVVVVVAAGPVETRISTEEPFAAFVPAGGLVLMTLPAGTVALACDFLVTVNPA